MSTHPGHVSSIRQLDGQIDDTSAPAAASAGERAVPYHCPYCADEDLRPLGATPGAWHCRTCTRTFSVKYLGMQDPTPPWPPARIDNPDPIDRGGSR
jgi:transposase-like protein